MYEVRPYLSEYSPSRQPAGRDERWLYLQAGLWTFITFTNHTAIYVTQIDLWYKMYEQTVTGSIKPRKDRYSLCPGLNS